MELSVVVPLFDEEDNVEPLHAELTVAVRGQVVDYELIFVDDGSRDETFAKLRLLCSRDPRVRVLRFRRNFGQTAALQAGFDHAVGRVVVTMDGDLQNDPADIGRLLEKIAEGYHVVSGWRRHRKDSLVTRRLPSQTANWLIRCLTGVPIHDNGCTLKAYRRDAVKKTWLYADMHRFLVPMLSLSGCRIAEVAVNHRPRQFGRSKYGLSRIWKVLLDLLALKMLLRFSSHPAAWFAVLSFPFVVVASLAFAGSLFFAGAGSSGELPLVLPSITVLSAFAAAHLLLLGMFAELVVRVGDYRETQPILIEVETKR